VQITPKLTSARKMQAAVVLSKIWERVLDEYVVIYQLAWKI
jgi:hypothetical protein